MSFEIIRPKGCFPAYETTRCSCYFRSFFHVWGRLSKNKCLWVTGRTGQDSEGQSLLFFFFVKGEIHINLFRHFGGKLTIGLWDRKGRSQGGSSKRLAKKIHFISLSGVFRCCSFLENKSLFVLREVLLLHLASISLTCTICTFLTFRICQVENSRLMFKEREWIFLFNFFVKRRSPSHTLGSIIFIYLVKYSFRRFWVKKHTEQATYAITKV